MIEELDEYGNPIEDNADDVGGLAVYSDPNVQKAMTKLDVLAKQQKDRYDAQALALKEKRYGPSFSERMFQLSAALASPTQSRGFGGILANVTPVLQAQMQAKRQGELTRREALEQLNKDQLEQQMGLAKQGLTTSIAMANLAKKGVGTGKTYDAPRGIWVDKANPRPTENIYDIGGGRTLVQWQDGLWREPLPNGGYKVFERAGDKFNELGIEGTR
jgi:hypothetical protein